jgi:MinD-like ATPase involved in chromosome partitioning or flagellar assembly
MVVFATCVVQSGSCADAKPNLRGGGAAVKTATAAYNLTSRNSKETELREQVAENSRVNRTTSSRGVVVSDRVGAKAVTVRSASPRSATTSRSSVSLSRAAAPVIQSDATMKTSTAARAAVRSAAVRTIASGLKIPAGRGGGTSSARATAIFANTSAMGTEYNQCREAYFACMDQFCGLKSDTYRRCLCSNRFREFKDREDAFDEAKQMILQFNDNNLNVVGMSASEVNAMYSATQGEIALKKDTSTAAKMLENINDLLSGKTKASSPVITETAKKISSSMDLNFSSAVDDIWGENPNATDIFSTQARSSEGVNIESLEGNDLYTAVHKQCMSVSTLCNSNQASGNMVTSAYTVLISQDCNAYEKKLDAQKSALESTIREANKILMEARLEDFQSHNSASVNDCISKVRGAVLDQYACGPNWEKCLDFSGLYINSITGEPIFGPLLFKLKDVINLYKPSDPVNDEFLGPKGLEKFKNRASSALDTCRSEADTVWNEFKQQALIEISQAQDAKVEAVKSSCLSIVKECYDSQTGQAKDFGVVKDDEEISSTVQSTTAALGQRFARSACKDKVSGCASLYAKPGDPICSFNENGELLNGGQCGMTTLLAFVDTVDDTKISMMCKRDLKQYMIDICTPEEGKKTSTETERQCNDMDGDDECSLDEIEIYKAQQAAQSVDNLKKQYPYQCRKMPMQGKDSVYEMLIKRANTVCVDPETNKLDESGEQAIREIMEDLNQKMRRVMQLQCEVADENGNRRGVWLEGVGWESEITIVPEWSEEVFETHETFSKTMQKTTTDESGKINPLKLIFGEAGAGGTALSMSATAEDSSGVPLMTEETAKAQGWGYCMLSTEKQLCEQINDIAKAAGGSGNVARYNNSTRNCEFESIYGKTLCEKLLEGRWDVNTNSCSYVPR